MLLANDFPPDSSVLASALSPEQVADLLVAGIAAEKFMILTPDADLEPFAARAQDYDAWLDRRPRR